MPGDHSSDECHDEAMIEGYEQEYIEEVAASLMDMAASAGRRVQEELLHQLYEALHPWGEPGEWPKPGTDCWVLYRDEVHDSMVMLEDVEVDVQRWERLPCVYLESWDETFWSTSEEGQAMRFRKRRTPNAP